MIYVDRFGNGITNLAPADLSPPGSEGWWFRVAGREIRGPTPAYGAVPEGEPVVVLGSAGLYEIAVNQGSAAERLGLQVGSPVEVAAAGPVSPRRKRGNP